MNIQNYPTVEAQMLIRKPVNEVFEAMINPDITSRFWFTRSSGRVEAGKTLVWEWGQFGVKDTVDILKVITNEYISLKWKLGDLSTHVEMNFDSHTSNTTWVKVKESGFWNENPANEEKPGEKIKLMLGQKGGWTIVLASMKAWLEHELDLNFIADHKPD